MESNTRDEVEARRGIAEYFFIALVEQIVDVAVDFDAARKAIRKSRIGIDVALVPEQALHSERTREAAVIRLQIEHRAANAGVGIEHQATVGPRCVIPGRTAR